MTYLLSTQILSKIWFSRNQKEFLNPLNQLRLVRLRAKNPDVIIHFIYSKTLLTEMAIAKMEHFRKKHNINPVSVEDDILPKCSAAAEEQTLIKIFQEEILIREGGNLGAASDVVRWLSPMADYGTYSDFDVDIYPKDLPEVVEVNSPILINAGCHEVGYLPDLQYLRVNNDIVSIVGKDEKASALLRKIQVAIGEAYYKDKFQCNFQRTQEQLSRLAEVDLKNNIIIQSRYEQVINCKLNPPNLKNACILDRLQREFPRLITLRDYLQLQGRLFSEDEDCQLIEDLLMLTVTYKTGPIPVTMGLFGGWLAKKSKVESEYAYSSFQNYPLLKEVYCSSNGGKLFMKEEEVITKFDADGNELGAGDLSWLSVGVSYLKAEERKLNHAALVIQGFFRQKKAEQAQHPKEKIQQLDGGKQSFV